MTRDGVSAPDGTAPVSDGILKSDDGAVLDWLLDREPVPGVHGLSAFLQPIADQWREVVLRVLFELATKQNVPLPLLWLYPRALPALAHLSHDTDGNDPDKARQLLDTLAVADVPATWCVIAPGYEKDLIDTVRRAGHELATHYDALSDGCHWGREPFDAQQRFLRELFGEEPVTNKNHYLRWEGDTEFFEWCAQGGLLMDQSKGASKTGEAGFNFGTCHPYQPVAPNGRVIPVLELPTPTQDLHVFAPEELAAPLMAAAERHHGILHLLFHPAHIDKPQVADSIIRVVRTAQERGLEWWTARQISAWERARRQVTWSDYRSGPEQTQVTLCAHSALKDATLLWLCPKSSGQAAVDGASLSAKRVHFWGFPFEAVVMDLAEDSAYTLRLRSEES